MDKDEIKMSFAAADVPFPAKLLHHRKLIESIVEKKIIPPIHLQLNPTNKCSFNCSFCSCKARRKGEHLRYNEIVDVLRTGKKLGMESVTITGGGEPLLHPQINRILKAIHLLGMQAGLVTNGSAFCRLKAKRARELVWCRVSASDELPRQLEPLGLNVSMWLDGIEDMVLHADNVDWAFSYVVSESEPDYELIGKIVDFANAHNFTHVRLVNNIFRADKLEQENTMHKISIKLYKRDEIVNYQKRSLWNKGVKKCYLALLKPVLGADGYWYPCCGTQYALKKPTYDYEPSMRLSEKRLAAGLVEIISSQKPFDGSKCVKCYYNNYNYALRVMLANLKHEAFV